MTTLSTSFPGTAAADAGVDSPSVFRRFERLQRLGMLGFAALLLALALLALLQGVRSQQVIQAHTESQALVGEINRLRGQLLDVEHALEIYQTTGSPALLRQRLRCEPPCPDATALRAQSTDPAQRALFARLADWEAALVPLLQQVLEDGPDAAARPLPAVMQMRGLLLQAEASELGALRRHDGLRRQQKLRLQGVLGATLLLAVAGGLWLQRRTRALVQAGLQAEAALEQASLRDALTGAYNRRALDLHVEGMLRDAQQRRQPLALLALDLDGFKAVNDGHGHAAGDAALREIVARLQGTLREADLLTRTGGDEFVIALQPPQDEAGARAAAQRLLSALSEPVSLPGGAQARLGASVGVAVFPRDGHNVRALLEVADAACYAAKRGGKNRVCVAGEAPQPAAAATALRRVH